MRAPHHTCQMSDLDPADIPEGVASRIKTADIVIVEGPFTEN